MIKKIFIGMVALLSMLSQAHAAFYDIGRSLPTDSDYYEIQIINHVVPTDDTVYISPFQSSTAAENVTNSVMGTRKTSGFNYVQFYTPEAYPVTASLVSFYADGVSVLRTDEISNGVSYLVNGYSYSQVRFKSSNSQANTVNASVRWFKEASSAQSSGDVYSTKEFVTNVDSGMVSSENFGPVSTGNIAGPLNLYGFDVWNKSPNDQYLFLYNDVDTVAASAKKMYLLPAVDNLVIGLNELGGSPYFFGAGLTLGVSTTDNVASFTAGDPLDTKWTVRYKP